MTGLDEETEIAKKFVVELSEAEQALLNGIMISVTQRVHKGIRANILLNANAG